MAERDQDEAAPNPREPEHSSLTWGLDPLLAANVKLLIAQVHGLREVFLPGDLTPVPALGLLGPNARPVRRVQVRGTVVLKIETRRSTIIGVDDGSAIIYVTVWESDAELVLGDDAKLLQNGAAVAVTGRLESEEPIQMILGDSTGRRRLTSDVRSIVASRVRILADPNEELLWWLEVIQAHTQSYDKDWHPGR